MMRIATALALGLALGPILAPTSPALAQASPQQHSQAMRALDQAEAELRGTLQQMEGGAMPGSMGPSRLRQALAEVERAMMQLPADSRRGAGWQTAVKELTEARKDGVEPDAQRAAATRLLGTLPALRGEDTGTGSS